MTDLKNSKGTQGDRVKQLRKHLRLSQEAFAESIGVTQGNISQIELNGTASIDILLKISEIHKADKIWLLEGVGEMFGKAEPKTEGAVFLSAATLFGMWQDGEKKHREERNEMIKVMLSLTDQLSAMRAQLAAKDLIIETTMKKIEQKVIPVNS